MGHMIHLWLRHNSAHTVRPVLKADVESLADIDTARNLVSSAIAGSLTRTVAAAVLRWRRATWPMSIWYIIEAMRWQGAD